MSSILSGISVQTGQYLTFILEQEQYGVEITKIREILGVLPITPMPQAPNYVKGVINLRGKVIPVIDARLKLGMPAKEYTPETCIIVVEVKTNWIGMLVDTVSEVMNIPVDQIETPPAIGNGGDDEIIRGLGKVGDRVTILLDIDRLLTDIGNSFAGK